MKQLSTKIFAISALVIAGFSATAQSNGQRNMTKRDAGNQQAPTNQGNVAYDNGNRNNQSNSASNDNRSGQYNTGQRNSGNNNQYGNRNQSFGSNNRGEQYGRHEENFGKRRPFLSIFFGNHRDYRSNDYNHGRERRHFDRNRRW